MCEQWLTSLPWAYMYIYAFCDGGSNYWEYIYNYAFRVERVKANIRGATLSHATGCMR